MTGWTARGIAVPLGILAAVNGVAWRGAWIAFADRPALFGSALLAWLFGLRHAADADHLAAIDNVVRTLMQEGQRPRLVGLFFSLGHNIGYGVDRGFCCRLGAGGAVLPAPNRGR